MKRGKISKAIDYLDEDLVLRAMEKNQAENTNKGARIMKRSIWTKVAAIAASLVILITGGIFLAQNLNGLNANAIIALDVNPSIELEVNKDEKVVDVKALNDDATTVIGGMDLKGVDLEVAVNALIGSMVENGYITIDQNSILISVDTENDRRASALQKSVSDKITAVLGQKDIQSSVITQNFDNANAQNGVSAGKAALINRIITKGITNSKGIPYEYEQLVHLNVNELKLMLESKGIKIDGIQTSGTASDGRYIGRERAIEIAYTDAGATLDTIARLEIDLDFDDDTRTMLYEVKFDYNGKEYEYELNAVTGEIVERDVGIDDDDDNVTPPDGAIGNDAALNAAYAHAKIDGANAREIDCELEYFNGRYYYEIDFEIGNTEYEYIIDALTGEVINSKTEIDD